MQIQTTDYNKQMSYRKEVMSNEFTKHLLDFETAGGKSHFVLHQFTGKDVGGPHCHPFSFTTHILKGGYTERVYSYTDDGNWDYQDIQRKPGTVHRVEAECIHEVIDLPEGECWTLMIPGPKTRDWGFWKFDEESVSFRLPGQDWTLVAPQYV